MTTDNTDPFCTPKKEAQTRKKYNPNTPAKHPSVKTNIVDKCQIKEKGIIVEVTDFGDKLIRTRTVEEAFQLLIDENNNLPVLPSTISNQEFGTWLKHFKKNLKRTRDHLEKRRRGEEEKQRLAELEEQFRCPKAREVAEATITQEKMWMVHNEKIATLQAATNSHANDEKSRQHHQNVLAEIFRTVPGNGTGTASTSTTASTGQRSSGTASTSTTASTSQRSSDTAATLSISINPRDSDFFFYILGLLTFIIFFGCMVVIAEIGKSNRVNVPTALNATVGPGTVGTGTASMIVTEESMSVGTSTVDMTVDTSTVVAEKSKSVEKVPPKTTTTKEAKRADADFVQIQFDGTIDHIDPASHCTDAVDCTVSDLILPVNPSDTNRIHPYDPSDIDPTTDPTHTTDHIDHTTVRTDLTTDHTHHTTTDRMDPNSNRIDPTIDRNVPINPTHPINPTVMAPEQIENSKSKSDSKNDENEDEWLDFALIVCFIAIFLFVFFLDCRG